jgi:4-amino-4-deoxy-L-arabinose transferase-like glycosyltransferase
MDIKKETSNHIQTGLISLAVFTAALALAIAISYRQQPILEFHGFRQTQTAITAYWMMQEGWQLDYQTPVAGYPWAIPFEFPIYQSIVALIAGLGGFPLDPIGRFVSLFFLFASALPAFGITRRLGLSREVPWVFSALVWSSPIYLFWGRTFMIETTALLFTFATVPYAIDLMDERPQWRSALWFMFWMTLGMLQKITTAFPVMIVLSLLIACVNFRSFGLRLPNWQKIIQILVAFAVPVIIGGLWSYYTDIVRSQNILGLELASKMLTTWNFGTVQQRFDFEVFKTIVLDRVFSRNLAGILGILVLGAALIIGQSRTRAILFTSLVLFLLPIEMFINVNLVHDYYQTSSALFVIGGYSIAIVDLVEKFTRNKGTVILVVTFVLVSLNLFIYKQTYWVLVDNLDESENQVLLVSGVLKKYTPTNSVIVMFGVDWDSSIAYYSERKSFAVPRWEERDWPGRSEWQEKYQKIWQNPEPYLGGEELGALVFCEGGDSQFAVEEILENQFVRRQPRLFEVSHCYLWLPNVDNISLPGSDQIVQPIDL